MSLIRFYIYAILHLFYLIPTTSGDEYSCGPPPLIREARLIGERNQVNLVGTVFAYECNVGYEKHGDSFGTCLLIETEASWNLSISCEAVDCGDPGQIENGIRIGNKWTHPNSVQYICEEGHVMNTNESPFLRHCQANKQWSNHLPLCLVVNCTTPDPLVYGSTNYHELSYGSRVIYDCGISRKLIGDSERECMKDGQWSGTIPQCIEIECPYPELTYPHGKVRMLAGTRINDRIKYECNDGTITEAICFNQGIWYPPPPMCLTGISVPAPTTTTEQPTTSTRYPSHTTPHPRRRNVFCKWKLFKWMCNLFN